MSYFVAQHINRLKYKKRDSITKIFSVCTGIVITQRNFSSIQ